jgi:hypothetical protein
MRFRCDLPTPTKSSNETQAPAGLPMTLANTLFVTVLKEMLWLSCLFSGIILMISAATEGFPFTSIYIRGEFSQDVVGALGLILAVVGVVSGFSFGKKRK